jgi:hypothetical protein
MMSSWGREGAFNSEEAVVFEDGSAGRFGVVCNHAVFLGLFVDLFQALPVLASNFAAQKSPMTMPEAVK